METIFIMKTFKNFITLGSVVFLLSAAAAAQAAEATNKVDKAEQKPPSWTGSAALGLSVTSGNSDSVLVTGNINAARKWEQNEVLLGLDGSYGKTEDTVNAETLHGFGQYNRLFGDRLYGYARADALHDGLADVRYRVTLSPGAGYYFIKDKQTTLSAEAGPGFIFEERGGIEKQYVALRLSQKFEHKFNDRFRVWEFFEYLPQVDRFSNYLLNAELGVEAGLTEKLKLRVFAVDNFVNEPAKGRKQNDLKLVSAIAWVF
jgi:putative salt-induced outer membrane protein